MNSNGWESVKDILKKLTTATLLVVVVSTFAYFIYQYNIPEDAGVIRGSKGQYIFDKELIISPSEKFSIELSNPTDDGSKIEFYVETEDTFLTLCNLVPIGTTLVKIKAVTYTQESDWASIIIIKTEDSLWSEPWPILPPVEPAVGYVFNFNEGEGDTIRALVPAIATGVLTGDVTWAVGQDGSPCLSFNDEYAGVNLIENIDSPSPDTLKISVLVYVLDFNVYDSRIVSKAVGTSGSDHWWMVSTFTDRSVRFRLKTSDGGVTTLISEPFILAVNQWHEIITKYDGNMMWIIVDDTVVGATGKTGSILQDNSAPVSIGNQPQGDRPFHGLIDSLVIQ